jgi:hypothetical protein
MALAPPQPLFKIAQVDPHVRSLAPESRKCYAVQAVPLCSSSLLSYRAIRDPQQMQPIMDEMMKTFAEIQKKQNKK